jgi:hypothetical protein
MIAHHGSKGHSFGLGAHFRGDPEVTGAAGWSLATPHRGLRRRDWTPQVPVYPARVLMRDGKRLYPPEVVK